MYPMNAQFGPMFNGAMAFGMGASLDTAYDPNESRMELRPMGMDMGMDIGRGFSFDRCMTERKYQHQPTKGWGSKERYDIQNIDGSVEWASNIESGCGFCVCPPGFVRPTASIMHIMTNANGKYR